MTPNDAFPYRIEPGLGPGDQSAMMQYFKGGCLYHYVAAKGVKQSAKSPPVLILKGEFADEGLVYTKQDASSAAQVQTNPHPDPTAELENQQHFEKNGADYAVRAFMHFTLHRVESKKASGSKSRSHMLLQYMTSHRDTN